MCLLMHFCSFLCFQLNIYICLPTPLKPTDFGFYCVLQYVYFCLQRQRSHFQSFEDFGCLSVMSCDASCASTLTFFDTSTML